MYGCDIIIPVWNRLQDTEACIKSIRENTLYPYRLLIIDNASGSQTVEYLKGLKKENKEEVLLIRNEKNEGFIKAVNKGISVSKAQYICILNNDTIVAKGWLTEAINVLNKDPLIGLVNPSSNTLGQKLSRDQTPDEWAEKSKGVSGQFVEIGSAFGFCMLAKKKLFDEIGYLDESYGMGNFDDTDFSLRAKQKGYKTVRALASYVYHKEQRSFNILKGFKRGFRRNRSIFENRWGKTKRVMLVFKDVNATSLNYLENVLREYAKEKSWVYIVSPRFETKKFFKRYSNLSFYNFDNFFYPLAFLKVLFKKKKPDIIYSDSKVFSDYLKRFSFLHSADIKKIEGTT